MFKQNNFKKLIILAIFSILSNYIVGQNITGYAFTASNGTFTAITGGTIPTLEGTIPLHDGFANNIPIGFTFYYMGLPYTTLAVSTNGFVSLGAIMTNSSSSNSLSLGTRRPILAPLWDDMKIAAASDLSYLTSGSEPNRVFTVQWNNVYWKYIATMAGIAFQLKIYEGTGVVEFIYHQLSGSLSSASASIGITGVPTSSGNYLSLNNSTSGATVSSTSETTTISAKPEEGQIFKFTPPAPPETPTNLTFSNISGTSMILNWLDNSTTESGFSIYKSLDGNSYSFVANVPANTTTYNASGLSFGNIYYWKVSAINGFVSSNFVLGSQMTNLPTLSGIKYVGTGTYPMDYATLTDAFAAVNNYGLVDNLVLILNTAYTTTETAFPITTPMQNSQGNYSITIYPSVTGLTITSAGTSTIMFDGAKNITIDGRVMATGNDKDLTIENTSTSGQALLFINDASNNLIKYCKVEGRNTSTSSGVIVFSTTTGTTGNDYITIDNCNISSDGTNYAANLIYSSGTSAIENDHITISNCNIFDFFSASSNTRGILFSSNTTQCTINNNSFYQTASRTFTSGVEMRAISIENSSGSGFTINNNYIGTDAPLCGGANPLILTSASLNHKFAGIYVYVGTYFASTISGNTISKVTLTGCGTLSQLQGIVNSTGISHIVSNTISNLSINSANTGTGNLSSLIGINHQTNTSTAGAQNVSQNTIFNLMNENSNAAVCVIGIYKNGGIMHGTLQRNNVYNLSTKSTGAAKIVGIQIGGGANIIINNMICLGNDNTNPNEISGILQSSGTDVKIYFNSVYIGGTTSGTAVVNSYAFQRNQIGQDCELKNNILVNKRTGSSGKHCAMKISTDLDYISNNLKSNYNIFLNENSANLILNSGISTVFNFETWNSTTNLDLNSLNSDPQFVDPTASTPDLHISTTVGTIAESSGLRITNPAITNDFENDIRWSETGYTGGGSTVDIGADEFTGIPSYSCQTTSPGNIVPSTEICLGLSTTLSLQYPLYGTGLSFQWKSSTDGTDYTDITDATSATYTFVPDTATYYKCTTTCLNCPTTYTSSPLLIDFANKITSATGVTECGPSQITLQATANNGAINWYDAPTGGNLVGTGSPFTTTVFSTTPFYVSAETLYPTTASVGSGTNQNTDTGFPAPYGNYWESSKHHILIHASELSAMGLIPGNITSLSFDVASVGTSGVHKGFTIQIANTTLNQLTTSFQTTGFTTVFDPVDYQPVASANLHTFTTPFYWDGTSNIIIETCFSNDPTGSDTLYTKNAIMNRTSTVYNSVAYVYADNTDKCSYPGTAETSRLRPNITLSSVSDCKSEITEVLVTITPTDELFLTPNQTVCNGSVATISVASAISNFDTYIWSPTANLFTDLECEIPYTGVSSTTVYAKTSSAGEYTYICTSEKTSSGCSNIATSTVTVLPASVEFLPANAEICTSGVIDFTVTPQTGYGNATYQWSSSEEDPPTFTNTVGTTLNYTTGILTNSTYYRLKINSGATTCIETIDSVIVYNPEVYNTTNPSRCGTGTVTLQAETQPGVELNWFDAETGGNLLATGASFTTPVIESTTDYWVEARAVFDDVTAGRLIPSGTTSYNYTGFGLVFTTENDIILNSVDVYPVNTNPSAMTIKLLDNTGVQVAGTSNVVFIPVAGTGTTAQTVTLNYSIPAGTGYRLVISGGMYTTNKLVEETSGLTYPIVNKPVTITSNWNNDWTSTNRYSWFYNWKVTPFCYGSGQREVVQAVVNEAPAFSINGDTEICEGESTSLSVSSTDNPEYEYLWIPGNVSTDTLNIQPLESTIYTVTATDNSGGTYDGCTLIEVIEVYVNHLPAGVTASASDKDIEYGQTINLHSTSAVGTFVIFEDNFNGTTNNWTTINNSTGGTNPLLADWTLRPDGYVISYFTFHSNDNSQFYLSNSDAAGSGVSVYTILESPAFSTHGLNSCKLTFYHYFRASGTAKVEAFDGTTWTTLKTYTTTQGASATFVKDTVDLIDYLNISAVKIRFVYTAGWDYYWAIDNVKIISDYPDFTYVWTSSPEGYSSDLQNPEATPLVNTTFNVEVINPITSCSNSASTELVVVGPPSGENDIIEFNIPSQISCEISSEDATVSVLMPYGTDVTALVPTISVSQDATISPKSGVQQDFTSPVIYTVMAENGITKNYDVTVTLQTTNINIINDEGISIYPNPSNGVFYLSVDKRYTLKISDIAGKIIFTKELDITTNLIDMNNYASGVYNLILYDGNSVKTYKIFIND